MRLKKMVRLILLSIACTASLAAAQGPDLTFLNRNRPLVDAHNCYPYDGLWNDRVQRALASGFPVSLEQDLAWYIDPATGTGRVVVSHTPKPTGSEPTLREYFFEQVRPVVEEAIAHNEREQWPLIVLHFDFKDNRPEILEAVWKLLGNYEPWLSTAVKSKDRMGRRDQKGRWNPLSPRPAFMGVTRDDHEIGLTMRISNRRLQSFQVALVQLRVDRFSVAELEL
jgi:hypothetical protein